MTSLPPDAAGRGDADRSAGTAGPNPAPVASPPGSPVAAPAPSTPPAPPAQRPPGTPRSGPRPLPPVRPSNAQVELSLDLRFTPPDKVLSRLFGALEQVGADVTLLVLLRDTPEYAGVVASAYQALRARGYVSDSARFPPGGQRLRVRRRPDREAPARGEPGAPAGEARAEWGGAAERATWEGAPGGVPVLEAGPTPEIEPGPPPPAPPAAAEGPDGSPSGGPFKSEP
jgi:hypothetical protein